MCLEGDTCSQTLATESHSQLMNHALHASIEVLYTSLSITHSQVLCHSGHSKASTHLAFPVVSLLHSDGEGTCDNASSCLVHRVGGQGAKMAVQQHLGGG